MKMLRLIVNVVIFAIGVGLGIVWGVHHPTQASTIALHEQIAASKAKIEVLTRVGGDNPTAKQMLTDEQAKLDEANKELAAQGN